MAKAKAKDTLLTKADTVRPYVERAMNDERLRAEVMRAFSTARDLYGDLIGDKDKPMVLASRVATDDEIRDKLREAIDDLRSASDRLQGKREARPWPRIDTARRGHRARDPLQPGDGGGDAALHPRPDLVGRRRRHATRRARTARASRRKPDATNDRVSEHGAATPGRGRRRSRCRCAPSGTTPGSGARIVPGTFGAHPVATGKARLAMCRQEARYGAGSTAPSKPRKSIETGCTSK